MIVSGIDHYRLHRSRMAHSAYPFIRKAGRGLHLQRKVAITLRRDEQLSVDIHQPRQFSTTSRVSWPEGQSARALHSCGPDQCSSRRSETATSHSGPREIWREINVYKRTKNDPVENPDCLGHCRRRLWITRRRVCRDRAGEGNKTVPRQVSHARL